GGHAGPRVAEFAGGMLNAVGLANPGLDAVRVHELPWLATTLRRARLLVNVAGATLDDYARVITGLTDLPVVTAFEINASCPNTSAGGLEFGANADSLRALVRRCRAVATRPLAVKLSPVLPDIAAMAQVARDEGADAVTPVNTIPGMLDRRLGHGPGGGRAGGRQGHRAHAGRTRDAHRRVRRGGERRRRGCHDPHLARHGGGGARARPRRTGPGVRGGALGAPRRRGAIARRGGVGSG